MNATNNQTALEVLQPRQALLLSDFHFFTKRCATRKHLRIAITQINKQWYAGKLNEETVYKACTSGKNDFYKIEELANGKPIILIDKIYKYENGIPTEQN